MFMPVFTRAEKEKRFFINCFQSQTYICTSPVDGHPSILVFCSATNIGEEVASGISFSASTFFTSFNSLYIVNKFVLLDIVRNKD